MRHGSALFTKLAYVEGVMLTVLLAVGATFAQAFSVGVVTTAVLYIMGDLVILPAYGNLVATLSDAGLAMLLSWAAPYYTDAAAVSPATALLIAIAVACAEYFFHVYVVGHLIPYTDVQD